MEIKTKFNLGDKIVRISHCTKEILIPCLTCDATGEIMIKDKKFECPDCYGEGEYTEYKPEAWYIVTDEGILSGYDNIVKIDVDITREETKIRYILGRKYSKSYSGTLWDENDLFKTTEEAEVECERRNKELEKLE